MKFRLIATCVFNIIDTIATLVVTQSFGFVEVIPLPAALIQISPLLFALAKLTAIDLLLLHLWKSRESDLANLTSWVAFIMYGLVMLHYVNMFTLILGGGVI